MRRLLTVMLLGLIAARALAEPEGFKTLAIGDKAPDFKLPGVDGKEYALADFAKAKLLAVVFTCNHCPTAQAYEERIIKLHADYQDRGVALVAISPNDPLAVRLDELGYTDVGDSFEDMKLRAAEQSLPSLTCTMARRKRRRSLMALSPRPRCFCSTRRGSSATSVASTTPT